MNADHCYFMVAGPSSAPASTPAPGNTNSNEGLLTPNESSDDDESSSASTMTASRTSAAHAASIAGTAQHRRRLAEAMNSLHKQQQQHGKTGGTASTSKPKFTFTLTVSNNKDEENTPPGLGGESRKRRSSAMKNQHCPIPSSSSVGGGAYATASSTGRHHAGASAYAPPAAKARRTAHPGATSLLARPVMSSSATPHRAGESQKSRDIRDLHNSMERARRVDLRLNFDQLRLRVPEIAHLEKASKLTILNKAASYVRHLDSEAARHAGERERAQARNAQLRRQLQQLTEAFDSSCSTSSSSSSSVRPLSGRRKAGSGAGATAVTASGRVVSAPHSHRHYY